MQVLIRSLIVGVSVAWAGAAPAAPEVDPRAQQKLAEQHLGRGDRAEALDAVDHGLAAAPKDRELRYLRCTVLFELDDQPGALAACKAFLEVSVLGGKQRQAREIVAVLAAKATTFLEVTVANGPADVHVGLVSRRTACRAAPTCKKAVSPGAHRVTVDRPGFERWTDRVTVKRGQTRQLAVTLIEKSSRLAVRATPPGARVTVDGAAYEAPTQVAPGEHRIAISLEGHAEERLEAVAREGRPIELEVALAPIVPIRIQPPGAAVELLLDGRLVAIRDGGLAVPAAARELRVRAPGFHDERLQLPAERGPDYRIAVRLRRVPPAVVKSPTTPRRKLAVAAASVGVTAAGAGAVLGLWARQLEGDARAVCPSTPCLAAPQANDLNRRGRSRALQANVAFGVAGGAAVAAAVLWLTGAPEARVAVTPRLGGEAGLDLAVRF